MRSHETSQAEAELEGPVDIPEHPSIPADEPEIIETDAALEALVEHVREIGSFAYDTEFIGELSYYPRLCLIQIGTPDRVALVDPLAGVSLDPIWSLIADPGLLTLVHAASQDLEPVMRLHGHPPQNIFDIQVAAGFVGLSYPLGLSRLIEEMLGIRIGKGLTFTHWDHRPLSDVHARYAADDVRFLPALYEQLRTELSRCGHDAWVTDECRALAEAAQTEHEPDALFRRIKGMHQLKPRKLAILRALTKLREQAARDHDVPPRSLLKDAVLIDLARNPAKSVQSLGKVPGLSRRIAQAYGERIITATQEALEMPKGDLPGLPDFTKETPADQTRIDALNALAAGLCHGHRIAPSLAVNRKDVGQLYYAMRRRRGIESCRLMVGWRRELVGDPLRDILEGRKEVTLHWREETLQAVLAPRDDAVPDEPEPTTEQD